MYLYTELFSLSKSMEFKNDHYMYFPALLC